MKKRAFLALCAAALLAAAPARAAEPGKHHVVFQIDVKDPAIMTLVLHNMTNMADYYAKKGEALDLELVAFGPGLNMLRDDTSPVKSELAEIHKKLPNLVFSACQNTRNAMSHAEGHDIPIVDIARMVPAGVVRLSELQEQGWTYLRP